MANTPWVPTRGAGGRVYAHGGPTGMELPERFLREGAALLAADGVLVVLCVDLRFDDGRAPLLGVLADLEADGFVARVDPTPAGHACHVTTAGAAGFLPGLESAHHVAVVVHRPSATDPVPSPPPSIWSRP